MEIVKIKSINEYKRLIAEFYKDDPYFINNKNGLIDLVCRESSAFYKLTQQEMIAVSSGGRIDCFCTLIWHKNDPDNLMIAFFECRKDCFDEVGFLLDYAASFGKRLGCKKMIASLDGHCNNSVGFLSNGDDRPGFGQSYNPLFYNDIFKKLNFNEIKLVSYCEDIAKLNTKWFDFAKKRMVLGVDINLSFNED